MMDGSRLHGIHGSGIAKVSAAEFRHITFGKGLRNCERIFRAAISAYCTLDRPTPYETTQLDDLTLGLFDAVPAEARRYAAAVLCETDPAPPGLVRRLCDEPVEIGAPLLVRSRALTDVDLIALIGRHGLAHARAIARRENLNPVIAALIRALLARAETTGEAAAGEPEHPQADALEDVRRHLRELMQQGQPAPKPVRDAPAPPAEAPASAGSDFVLLRDSALASEGSRFTAALANALRLPPERARGIAAGITYADLLIGLKAMGLTPEQAFLLTAAKYPAQVTHRTAIRLFLDRYESMDREAACQQVADWQHADGRRITPFQSAARVR